MSINVEEEERNSIIVSEDLFDKFTLETLPTVSTHQDGWSTDEDDKVSTCKTERYEKTIDTNWTETLKSEEGYTKQNDVNNERVTEIKIRVCNKNDERCNKDERRKFNKDESKLVKTKTITKCKKQKNSRLRTGTDMKRKDATCTTGKDMIYKKIKARKHKTYVDMKRKHNDIESVTVMDTERNGDDNVKHKKENDAKCTKVSETEPNGDDNVKYTTENDTKCNGDNIVKDTRENGTIKVNGMERNGGDNVKHTRENDKLTKHKEKEAKHNRDKRNGHDLVNNGHSKIRNRYKRYEKTCGCCSDNVSTKYNVKAGRELKTMQDRYDMNGGVAETTGVDVKPYNDGVIECDITIFDVQHNDDTTNKTYRHSTNIHKQAFTTQTKAGPYRYVKTEPYRYVKTEPYRYVKTDQDGLGAIQTGCKQLKIMLEDFRKVVRYKPDVYKGIQYDGHVLTYNSQNDTTVTIKTEDDTVPYTTDSTVGAFDNDIGNVETNDNTSGVYSMSDLNSIYDDIKYETEDPVYKPGIKSSVKCKSDNTDYVTYKSDHPSLVEYKSNRIGDVKYISDHIKGITDRIEGVEYKSDRIDHQLDSYRGAIRGVNESGEFLGYVCRSEGKNEDLHRNVMGNTVDGEIDTVEIRKRIDETIENGIRCSRKWYEQSTFGSNPTGVVNENGNLLGFVNTTKSEVTNGLIGRDTTDSTIQAVKANQYVMRMKRQLEDLKAVMNDRDYETLITEYNTFRSRLVRLKQPRCTNENRERKTKMPMKIKNVRSITDDQYLKYSYNPFQQVDTHDEYNAPLYIDNNSTIGDDINTFKQIYSSGNIIKDDYALRPGFGNVYRKAFGGLDDFKPSQTNVKNRTNKHNGIVTVSTGRRSYVPRIFNKRKNRTKSDNIGHQDSTDDRNDNNQRTNVNVTDITRNRNATTIRNDTDATKDTNMETKDNTKCTNTETVETGDNRKDCKDVDVETEIGDNDTLDGRNLIDDQNISGYQPVAINQVVVLDNIDQNVTYDYDLQPGSVVVNANETDVNTKYYSVEQGVKRYDVAVTTEKQDVAEKYDVTVVSTDRNGIVENENFVKIIFPAVEQNPTGNESETTQKTERIHTPDVNDVKNEQTIDLNVNANDDVDIDNVDTIIKNEDITIDNDTTDNAYVNKTNSVYFGKKKLEGDENEVIVESKRARMHWDIEYMLRELNDMVQPGGDGGVRKHGLEVMKDKIEKKFNVNVLRDELDVIKDKIVKKMKDNNDTLEKTDQNNETVQIDHETEEDRNKTNVTQTSVTGEDDTNRTVDTQTKTGKNPMIVVPNKMINDGTKYVIKIPDNQTKTTGKNEMPNLAKVENQTISSNANNPIEINHLTRRDVRNVVTNTGNVTQNKMVVTTNILANALSKTTDITKNKTWRFENETIDDDHKIVKIVDDAPIKTIDNQTKFPSIANTVQYKMVDDVTMGGVRTFCTTDRRDVASQPEGVVNRKNRPIKPLVIGNQIVGNKIKIVNSINTKTDSDSPTILTTDDQFQKLLIFNKKPENLNKTNVERNASTGTPPKLLKLSNKPLENRTVDNHVGSSKTVLLKKILVENPNKTTRGSTTIVETEMVLIDDKSTDNQIATNSDQSKTRSINQLNENKTIGGNAIDDFVKTGQDVGKAVEKKLIFDSKVVHVDMNDINKTCDKKKHKLNKTVGPNQPEEIDKTKTLTNNVLIISGKSGKSIALKPKNSVYLNKDTFLSLDGNRKEMKTTSVGPDRPYKLVDVSVQTHSHRFKEKEVQTDLASDLPHLEVDEVPNLTELVKFILETPDYSGNLDAQKKTILLDMSRNTMENKNQTNASKKKTELKKQLLYDLQTCLNHDSCGNMPIHNAVIDNDLRMLIRQIYVLTVRNISVNEPNSNGYIPIQLAIINNSNIAIISKLLESGADTDIIDENGNNLLHLALLHSTKAVLTEVLSKCNNFAIIDATNDEGLTPLMLGAINNKIDLVEVLLEIGANPNIRDTKSGRTALFHAVENDADYIITLLLRFKADSKISNYLGVTAIDVARYTSCGKFLLDEESSPGKVVSGLKRQKKPRNRPAVQYMPCSCVQETDSAHFNDNPNELQHPPEGNGDN